MEGTSGLHGEEEPNKGKQKHPRKIWKPQELLGDWNLACERKPLKRIEPLE